MLLAATVAVTVFMFSDHNCPAGIRFSVHMRSDQPVGRPALSESLQLEPEVAVHLPRQAGYSGQGVRATETATDRVI